MKRAALLAALATAACQKPAAPAPPQPIPFDHSIHVAVEIGGGTLACTDCHPGAARGDHAGLPALSTCLRCHMRPQGNPPSEDERRVRLIAAAGGPFRWIQVTRNPGHVHFSHAAHVSLAGMVCAECHGDVATWRRPPTIPNQNLKSMRSCMGCHRERGAPVGCGTCHQ